MIDDDPAITRVLEVALELQAGWTARFVRDEADARAALAHAIPNYILLDLCLANADGLAVLASLRADHELSNTLVVVMTAGASPLTPSDLTDHGVSHALSKPFDPLALPALLTRR